MINIYPPANSSQLAGKKHTSGIAKVSNVYPKLIVFLFYVFSVYLVLPFVDVPLLDLSLSAPIFFLVAVACFFKPPCSWFQAYRDWILLAVWLWAGIFISAVANGFLSGGINLDINGILTVIRYAYWLLVFVVTAYFTSQGLVLQKISTILGWSIYVLALLRWGEALIYGNFGAWTGTYLMAQNSYGFQFSTFSPFLLSLVFQGGRGKKLLAWLGNFALWSAMAINGSRGSWVAVAVGLALCLILMVVSRPKIFWGFLGIIIISVSLASAMWVSFPQVSSTISSRFNTFEDLDEEKSYMIRQLMIQKGWRLFEQSPIIGVGASRFTLSSTQLDIPLVLSYAAQDRFDVKSAHNSYVGFLAESGILGALPFAVLLVYLGVGSFQSILYFNRRGQYWPLFIFISLIQMSIHMWVISSLTNTTNWFIYGLAAASVMLYRQRKWKKCE